MPDTKDKEIEVKSYQKIAREGSWRARSRGLWATAAVGLAFGLAIGVAAPFIPVIAGIFSSSIAAVATVQSAMAAIPASMAIFAAAGMTAGAAIGATVGSSSGAAAAIAKEMETRTLKREQETGKLPSASITSPTAEKKEKTKYINPKVAATFAAFGAVAGAVLAASFIAPTLVAGGAAVASSSAIPALTTVLGSTLASNAAAATAYSVGVMAMFGAIFGMNSPKIISNVDHVVGKLLAGKGLGTSEEKKQEASQSIANDTNRAIAPPKQHPSPTLEPSFTDKFFTKSINQNKITSYREMIAEPAKKALDDNHSRM